MNLLFNSVRNCRLTEHDRWESRIETAKEIFESQGINELLWNNDRLLTSPLAYTHTPYTNLMHSLPYNLGRTNQKTTTRMYFQPLKLNKCNSQQKLIPPTMNQNIWPLLCPLIQLFSYSKLHCVNILWHFSNQTNCRT